MKKEKDPEIEMQREIAIDSVRTAVSALKKISEIKKVKQKAKGSPIKAWITTAYKRILAKRQSNVK